jgi:hypothetical protein
MEANSDCISSRIGLFGDAEVAAEGVGIESGTETIEQFAGGAGLGGAADPAGPGVLLSEEEVFPDAHGGDEIELLIDDGDPEASALMGRRDADGVAVELDGSGVGWLGAGEDPDEGALAGAVLAEEGVDFAGAEFEATVLKRSDAGKRLLDSGQDEEGSLAVRGHWVSGAAGQRLFSVGSRSASAFR